MANLRQTFIENLKYYRKQGNLRQLDLALEIGKSANYINSIENGKYFPPPETIDEIAAVLKIEPQMLFDSSISASQKETLAEETFAKIKPKLFELIEESLKPQIIELIKAEVE